MASGYSLDPDKLARWQHDEEQAAVLAASVHVDPFVGFLFTDILERLVLAIRHGEGLIQNYFYVFCSGRRSGGK